jgi:putative membrane protein
MTGTDMMMDGMGMMIWGVFSFLLGLLLIFVFVVAIAAAVKRLWGQKFPFVTPGSESALDILKKCYAKGEIDKEEYEKIKKDVE